MENLGAFVIAKQYQVTHKNKKDDPYFSCNTYHTYKEAKDYFEENKKNYCMIVLSEIITVENLIEKITSDIEIINHRE